VLDAYADPHAGSRVVDHYPRLCGEHPVVLCDATEAISERRATQQQVPEEVHRVSVDAPARAPSDEGIPRELLRCDPDALEAIRGNPRLGFRKLGWVDTTAAQDRSSIHAERFESFRK
jgi:hypothetical protein